MTSVLVILAKIVLAITVFDLAVVLLMMLVLRLRRSGIRNAPFTPVETLALDPELRRAHNHYLPLQDGWTKDETLEWAKSGRDFPDRLFNLQQMLVVFPDGDECPICVARSIRVTEAEAAVAPATQHRPALPTVRQSVPAAVRSARTRVAEPKPVGVVTSVGYSGILGPIGSVES